jgi:putative membrane protein
VDTLLTRLSNEVTATVDEIDRAVRSFDGLAGNLAETAAQFEATASPMSAIASQMQATSTSLNDAVVGFQAEGRDVLSSLSALAESVVSTAGEMTKNSSQSTSTAESMFAIHERRFSQIDADLGRLVGQLHDQFASFQEASHKYLVSLDGELERAVRKLAGGVDAIRESFDGFTEALERQDLAISLPVAHGHAVDLAQAASSIA